MPNISIALATYNGAVFLASQLQSLAAQRQLPFELVVTDDQSSDDTVRILEAFAASAPFPVRIHVNEARLGWRANFVKAVGLCQGDLISLCDQDDVWYPNKLATVAAAFTDPSVLLVYHNADLIDERGTTYSTLMPIAATAQRIVPLSRPTDWSNPLGLVMTFRRWLTRYDDLWAASVDLFAPGNQAAHDQWFYYLATNLGQVIALPERLLGYRQHGTNSVGWTHASAPKLLLRQDAILHRLDHAIGMLGPFSQILGTAAMREDGECKLQLTRAQERNQRYLEQLRTRRALYGTPRFVERLRILSRLVRDKAYDQRVDWGFGRRALLNDLTNGLFHGRS
jgi:glycosyltransferase involved in cell wall biosynthesis